MIIKAGTYRFNDVLSAPSNGIGILQNISFTTSPGIDLETGALADGSICWTTIGVAYGNDEIGHPGELLLAYAGYTSEMNIELGAYIESMGFDYPVEQSSDENLSGYGQTITIPTDTEVSAEFYEWFAANAVEVVEHTVSGVWKFKDDIQGLADGQEIVLQGNFSVMLENPMDASDPIYLYCDSMSFIKDYEYGVYGHYNVADVSHPKIAANFGFTEFPTELTVYYRGSWEDSDVALQLGTTAFKTIDFGTEPQTVSAEFYAWLTENANPVVEETPIASIHYNGTTIMTLFGGQKATLFCKDKVMQTDVVVEVAENVGGGASGDGVTVVPLTVTENGVYDNPLKPITETWNNTMQYDIPFDDSVAFRKVENLSVPNSLDEINSGNYILSVTVDGETTTAIVGVDIPAMDALGDGSLFMIGDLLVLFVKSASSFNEYMGVSVFEDNTVYVSNVLCLSAENEWSISLSAPSNEKADGYLPVKIDIPFEDLEVTPSRFGKTYNGYFKQVKINDIPYKSLTIIPSVQQQKFSYERDENGNRHEQWIGWVTVEAVDMSKMEVLCDIELETLPKTEYKVGEWLDTTGGVILRHYTNGTTYRISLVNSDIHCFVIDSAAGTYVTQQPGVYKLVVEDTKNGITCRTTYDITVTE